MRFVELARLVERVGAAGRLATPVPRSAAEPLAAVLDPLSSGVGSKLRFNFFVRTFADGAAADACVCDEACVQSALGVATAPWFAGQLSLAEAELCLAGRMPGTFLVRLGMDGNLAAAFVHLAAGRASAAAKVVHVTVRNRRPEAGEPFVVEVCRRGRLVSARFLALVALTRRSPACAQEEDGDCTFRNIADFVDSYLDECFIRTAGDLLPPQRPAGIAYFAGDISAMEADLILSAGSEPCPHGTFLVRYSGHTKVRLGLGRLSLFTFVCL